VARFIPAKIIDIDRILALYERVKSDLAHKGILQWGTWGNNYPGEEVIRDWISSEELFIYTDDNPIMGSVALNEHQSDEWSILNWAKAPGRILVVHALAVEPSSQGKGFGRIILQLSEEHARARGYEAIRLDSFAKNPVSNALYTKNGYRRVGSVFFDEKPEGEKEYFCYEKDMD
jgi:ribosomal protein S18 acetylase RimI-like enzyme